MLIYLDLLFITFVTQKSEIPLHVLVPSRFGPLLAYRSKKLLSSLILLIKAIGIFKRLVKILGAGPRTKHKQRNSYKFPSH